MVDIEPLLTRLPGETKPQFELRVFCHYTLKAAEKTSGDVWYVSHGILWSGSDMLTNSSYATADDARYMARLSPSRMKRFVELAQSVCLTDFFPSNDVY